MSVDVGELLGSIAGIVLLLIVVGAAVGAVVWWFAILSTSDEPRWWVSTVVWLVLLVGWPVVGLLLWLLARRPIDGLLERLQPDPRPRDGGRPPRRQGPQGPSPLR